MAKKPLKTNAVRLLEKAGVPHTTVEYPVDEQHLDARHVADAVGEDIRAVYKTLVLRGDKTGHLVCVIPGDHEVDLKKAARASGNKKVEMIAMKELLPTTGYIRGGCSPIGMKKPFATYIQQDCLSLAKVFISAGVRGMQLCLAPQDLIDFTGATPADLITEQTI